MEKTVEEHKGIELLDSGKREFHEVVGRFGKILGEAAELSEHYLDTYTNYSGGSVGSPEKGIASMIDSHIENGMGSLEESARTIAENLVDESNAEIVKIIRVKDEGTGVNHADQVIEGSKSLFDKLFNSKDQEEFATIAKEITDVVDGEKNYISTLLIGGNQAVEAITMAIMRAMEIYGEKGDEFSRSLSRLSEVDRRNSDVYKQSLNQRYGDLMEINSDRLKEILSELRKMKPSKSAEE